MLRLLLFTDPHPKTPGPIRLGPRVRCEVYPLDATYLLFALALTGKSSFQPPNEGGSPPRLLVVRSCGATICCASPLCTRRSGAELAG